jgi:hypothetical protein
MKNQKAQIVLGIFFLDDIQAKKKIRMFDIPGLQQLTMNFEARQHKSVMSSGC